MACLACGSDRDPHVCVRSLATLEPANPLPGWSRPAVPAEWVWNLDRPVLDITDCK